jgi:hypothetical protein
MVGVGAISVLSMSSGAKAPFIFWCVTDGLKPSLSRGLAVVAAEGEDGVEATERE